MRILERLIKPKVTGLIGMLGVGWFMLVIAVLNFITPDYSIPKYTVSALAVHQYGNIYTVSMLFFSLCVFVLGLGVGQKLDGRRIGTSIKFFSAFAIGTAILALFKMDLRLDFNYARLAEISLSGKIHFYTTFLALFIFPASVYFLLKDFASDKWWRRLIPYSQFVLISSFVLGAVWFILFVLGYGYDWKGIFQKIIIFNLLMWVMTVSYWLFREEQK